jgi:predicted nucleotide-binding protein
VAGCCRCLTGWRAYVLVEDGEVRYAVVPATPDDEGHPRSKPDEKRFRARQNVVLELGH